MTKQNAEYLTLDKIKDMIDLGVLSLDKDLECSEDEDFEPIANNKPYSSEVLGESSDGDSDKDNELHRGTADRVHCNGTYWNDDPPPTSMTPSHNILGEQPCPVLW